jgi:hypothetical protein
MKHFLELQKMCITTAIFSLCCQDTFLKDYVRVYTSSFKELWGGQIMKLSTKHIHFKMLITSTCYYHSPNDCRFNSALKPNEVDQSTIRLFGLSWSHQVRIATLTCWLMILFCLTWWVTAIQLNRLSKCLIVLTRSWFNRPDDFTWSTSPLSLWRSSEVCPRAICGGEGRHDTV